MVDNAPATALGQSAVASPQVVVIRERAANTNNTFVLGTLAVLLAIVATITVSIGSNISCSDPQCGVVSQSCALASYTLYPASVCFLIAAIVQYYRMRKASRLNKSNPRQQPVIVSPGYPGQTVIDLNTMSAQYPPPNSPPTVLAPYPPSPAANQHPQNVGFTGNTNATHM